MSALRILVPIKRVIEYAVKPRVNKAQTGVETVGVKHSMNPFDELSVEEATVDVLRTALAMGADRVVYVDTGADDQLEPLMVAKLLRAVVAQQRSNLVMLGKQSIEDDAAQTGPMLAGLLDWPQATQAVKILFEDGAKDTLLVTREVDGGVENMRARLPLVVTTELRLNEPRYASLPKIMKAKRMPIEKLTLQDLQLTNEKRLKTLRVTDPPTRHGGAKVKDVDGLISKLKELGAL